MNKIQLGRIKLNVKIIVFRRH